MAPVSQPKAKPIRKKATARKKKTAIDSDKETIQNPSIELELDSDMEKLSGHYKNKSDDKNTIHVGFSIQNNKKPSI